MPAVSDNSTTESEMMNPIDESRCFIETSSSSQYFQGTAKDFAEYLICAPHESKIVEVMQKKIKGYFIPFEHPMCNNQSSAIISSLQSIFPYIAPKDPIAIGTPKGSSALRTNNPLGTIYYTYGLYFVPSQSDYTKAKTDSVGHMNEDAVNAYAEKFKDEIITLPLQQAEYDLRRSRLTRRSFYLSNLTRIQTKYAQLPEPIVESDVIDIAPLQSETIVPDEVLNFGVNPIVKPGYTDPIEIFAKDKSIKIMFIRE